MPKTKQEIDSLVQKILDDLKSERPSDYKKLMSVEAQLIELRQIERESRAKINPLLSGKALVDARLAFFGDDAYHAPKTEKGKQWGMYARSHLATTGISKSATYKRAEAWREAIKMIPDEAVVLKLAGDTRMIGVAATKEQPFGKYTETIEELIESDVDVTDPEFIERVLTAEIEHETKDALGKAHKFVVRTIKTVLKKDKTNLDMARKEAYTFMSNLGLAFGWTKTMDVEPANTFPLDEEAGYVTYQRLLDIDAENAAKRKQEREADNAQTEQPKAPKAPKPAKPASKKPRKQTTEVMEDTQPDDMGYYVHHNPKPVKPHESEPHEVHNKKGKKALVYRANRPDALLEAKKLRDKDAAAKHNDEKLKAKGASAGA
jgi:hypothetical protein